MPAILNMNEARDKLMVALDLETREQAELAISNLKTQVGYFKVGLQLFTKEGADLVRSVRKRGGKVFLDVKYHDIPTTVELACRAACSLGVDFINVHALGGRAMIAGAVKGLKEGSARMHLPRPRLLAVTILTSHDARSLKSEVGLKLSPEKEVIRLAVNAKKAGADGVVCSAREVAAVRKACGPRFVIVTPGIRPSGASRQDQKRVVTPAQAIASGSDFLVVGRPILKAADPASAARAVVAEIHEALQNPVKKTVKKKKTAKKAGKKGKK